MQTRKRKVYEWVIDTNGLLLTCIVRYTTSLIGLANYLHQLEISALPTHLYIPRGE